MKEMYFMIFFGLILIWFIMFFVFKRKIWRQKEFFHKFAKEHKFDDNGQGEFFGRYREHTLEFSYVDTPDDLQMSEKKVHKKHKFIRTLRTYVKNPLQVTLVANKNIPDKSPLLNFLITGMDADKDEISKTNYGGLKVVEYEAKMDLIVKSDNEFEMKNTLTEELALKFNNFKYFAVLVSKGIIEARIMPYTFNSNAEFEEFVNIFYELVNNIEEFSN